MKHFSLFLFDTADSIEASGSSCCHTQASVEMSQNVTLPYGKGGGALTLFPFSSLLFSFLFSSRSTEQTRLVSLAQKGFKEHMSAGTGCEMWSTVGCLALHFSQRALQKSGKIWRQGGGGGTRAAPQPATAPAVCYRSHKQPLRSRS